MRDILFKAKRIIDREWTEGDYWKDLIVDQHFIRKERTIENRFTTGDCQIIPETICQYTGMKDRYGNKIWENDIARYKDDEIVTIEWDDDYRGFAVTDGTWTENLGEFEEYELEVIENMFDNSEILQINELDYL